MVLFSLLFCLTACAHNPSGETGVPIASFFNVEGYLFRGAQPDAEGMFYLAKLGIKTIVDLNTDDIDVERQEAESLRINFRSFPLSGFFAPKHDVMQQIEVILEDPTAYPVYVHCEHGHDRTGLVIGQYRVHKDGWTKSQAWDEMLKMGYHEVLLGLTEYFWFH